MQLVVVVAVAALVLPSIIVTWSTQVRTANYACQLAVAYYAPGATGSKAAFSLADPQLAGWNCFAEMFDGSEYFVAHLGVIPGAPRLVPLTGS
jgi:allophanate hydrolase subunit 1